MLNGHIWLVAIIVDSIDLDKNTATRKGAETWIMGPGGNCESFVFDFRIPGIARTSC